MRSWPAASQHLAAPCTCTAGPHAAVKLLEWLRMSATHPPSRTLLSIAEPKG